jgi:hypothetical protein
MGMTAVTSCLPHFRKIPLTPLPLYWFQIRIGRALLLLPSRRLADTMPTRRWQTQLSLNAGGHLRALLGQHPLRVAPIDALDAMHRAIARNGGAGAIEYDLSEYQALDGVAVGDGQRLG